MVYYGSTKLTNPIIELKKAAVKISEGDYDSVVENKFNDELGELVESFNIMSEQLKIQKEQIQIDKKNRLSSIIDAQEKERQRLSRDLHDGLGQMLMAIKMKIEQAKANSEKSKQYIIDSLELIKNTIADLRAISNDLMPSVLINFGLKDGMQKLCRDSAESSGIIINFECNNIDNLRIENKEQIYIYRIIQELVNNILKHSKAANAEIIVNYAGDNLSILLKDDGIGFETNRNYTGNGLNNISDRVELLNGKLEINSKLNLGTEINITIPLNYG